MAANGISNLSTKQAKQVAKLNLAQNKRKGYTLNADGSIASGPDTGANFYRTHNIYTLAELPESYTGNNVTNNNNGANLIQGRPWAPVIATSGLQLYLDAANPASYPGTGNAWNDLSGNGNQVIKVQPFGENYITYHSDGGGYFALTNGAYFFRGSLSNGPTGNSHYSMSVWAQIDGSWGSRGLIGIGHAQITNHTNQFRTTAARNFLNYWWSDDLNAINALIDPTKWFNAVAQWDGTTRSIWVNGVLVRSLAAAGLNVSDPQLQVGATNINGGEPLNGNIGQALIYNRALTSTEIQQNFNATRTRYGL